MSAWKLAMGLVLSMLLVASAAFPAIAESHARIVRLSNVSGTVTIDRNTGDGPEKAILNMPVTEGIVLGHIQRGGSPSAFDRVLATRYGLGAIDMVHRGEFGHMAALRGNKIVSIPLAEAIASNRKLDKEILEAASGILDKLIEKDG